MKKILQIENFTLDFNINGKACHGVNDISIEINEGELVALVGESGCGKTLTALSAIGLSGKSANIAGGKIIFEGRDMSKASQAEWNTLRGKDISMIFQEPMTALNPLLKVGRQIAENAQEHGQTKEKSKELALEIMNLVGLADSERLYEAYPHQLSGGMRQRIMIAMALVNKPGLLIADEPTTALDVTIQAQIMELIQELNKKTGTAVLLISHDLGVVQNLCDRVYIMYAGTIVESGDCKEILSNPQHPYTKGLLASIPHIAKKNERLTAIPGLVPPLGQRAEKGCLYANRCPYCKDICNLVTPQKISTQTGTVACHLYGEAMNSAGD